MWVKYLVPNSFAFREGNGTPLQYSCWKIPWTEEPGRLQSMRSLRVGHDWATSLSLFTFTFHFHALEKEIATYSSVLAWRIPGTGEPDGLPSMGSHRVGHDWSDLAEIFLELFWFFDDPMDVGNLISGCLPFLNPAWSSGNFQFTYCWSLLRELWALLC